MIKEDLTKYAKKMSKSKQACKKYKWACLRFLKDLKRIGKKNFPYYFDESEAQRFFDWCNGFRHTKGVLAGQRIQLTDHQRFIYGQLYGWRRVENPKHRRFKNLYYQVGRKNAKSQDLACVSSYGSVAEGENMSEVYIGATKREQAKIVHNEIIAQFKGNELLNRATKVAYGKITHEKSGSIIATLSKEDNKKGDGLNPNYGIIDEYHAHPTTETFDILESGMGARPNPLMAIITTAGFNMICPCIDEYLYCSKILDPNNPMQNDEYLVIICELDEGDDITKPNTWIKANPILCSYKEGRAYIKSRLKKALDEPTKMRDFLTKNMNKWVNMIENGYMDMEKWAKVAKKMKIQDMAGLKCICGIDLSSTTDLTSISFLFYVNGVYKLFNHSFMPKNKLVEATRRDKVPYDLWNKYGYITLTEGDVVDYDYIHEYMNKIRNMGIDIIEVVYDPYNSSQFITKLMMDDFICIEARQGIKTLGTPTKEFRDSVYNGSLEHEDNPCLTWATGNALLRFDGGGNFIIMKRNRNAIQRIDPTASAINAFLRRESLENHIEDLYKVIELG